MMKGADGSAGLVHRITKLTAWREGVGRRIFAKKRGKNGQGIGNVTLMCKFKRVSLMKS